MKTKSALRVLSALAQETRLGIFRLLVERGPEGMPAGAIAERLGIPAATLSFHLKELSHAGLVSYRQEGRFVFYSADFDTMDGLLAFLTENCCGGNWEICAPAKQRAAVRKLGSAAPRLKKSSGG